MPQQKLHLSNEQRLQQTLSPLQVRYFKMLEMSDARMEEEVRRALDENPALEVKDADDAPADTFEESAEQMQLADYRNEDDIPSYRLEARNHSVNDRYFEPTAVEADGSLMDVLSDQLSLTDLSETDKAIGRYIIGNIDDNGYLTRTPDVLADDITMAGGVEVSPAQVRRVLETIRSLDPAGVGAYDLRDCLLLQLKRREPTPEVMAAREITGHYFDLFSKKHYDKIESATGLSREQLRDAVAIIRSLNPKPGSEIGGGSDDDRLRHVTPDFAVEADPNDNLTVTLLSNIPELSIEKTFDHDTTVAAKPTRGQSEADTFIRHKRDEAQGFIRIVKMRNDTLFRVMSAIVKLQRPFFLSGNEAAIKPMILKDVSALTGDDQSVISRATSGKYVSTPWGIFPLKHFFNEKFSSEAPNTSSREILTELKALIDAENPRKPLSDEALSQALAKKGYDVARRTVTKYREQLSIPVARLRREL